MSGQSAAREVGQQRAQRIALANIRIAIGRDDTKRFRSCRALQAHQSQQQVKSVGAGPLKVIKHEHRSAVSRHVFEEARDRAKGEPALVLRGSDTGSSSSESISSSSGIRCASHAHPRRQSLRRSALCD